MGDHCIPDLDNIVIDPPVPAPGDGIKVTESVTCDKDLSSIMVTTSGLLSKTFDACDGLDLDMPLGLGHISYAPAGCPIPSGKHESTVEIKLSALLPAGLSKTSRVTAVDQDGKPIAWSS